MKSSIGITGRIIIRVGYPDGSEDVYSYKNIITDWGMAALTAAFLGTAMDPAIGWLAVGSGTAAVSSANIELQTELYRNAAAPEQLTGGDDNKARYIATWNIGEIEGTFSEAGLFDDASTGNMFNRVVFPGVLVTLENNLSVSWVIEFDNK